MTWSELPFQELYAEPSRNGVYKPKEAHGRGAKIVNMGELFAYEFVGPQRMNRLSMSEQELEISGLRDGDLLFGRRSLVEAGAGKCSIVSGISEPTTFESSIIRVRLNQQICEPKFYYYWFRSHLGKGRIRSIVSGTNVKGIRGSDLKCLKVSYPELLTQRRIVDIIKNYDELIQNNTQRVALLETATRLLYREWFVYLRFPGHHRLRVVAGVPEGWEIKPLSELCRSGDGIQTGPFGSQLHQSDYTELGVPVVMPKDIQGFRIQSEGVARIPEDVAERLGRHRMEVGDTVYGRRGDIGRRAYIGRRQAGWLCGTGCLRIRPDPAKIVPRYLFEALGSQQTAGFIANQAKGSTMPNLSAGALQNVPILYPSIEVQSLFVNEVEATVELSEVLTEQNRKLAEARDLLLPRLMSGEIEV